MLILTHLQYQLTEVIQFPWPLSTELKFLKAVGVGEELTARVEIESVRNDKPICKLKTTITDSAGDLCVDGTATTYTMALKGL